MSGAVAIGIGGLLAALSLLVFAPGAAAAIGPYVSLGDSYTAGPLIPTPTGKPILCGRSTHNYPSDVSRVLAPSRFTDASCSGATTVNMTHAQHLGGRQSNPPQFNALSGDDALVTLGIGGNDAGLISVAEECARLDLAWPFGDRCKQHYESGGTDPNVAAIRATGPKVAAVIRGIRARAPVARIEVVGYPDGLPVTGRGCWPVVPFSNRDVAYVNRLEQRLNSVLERVARTHGVTYVDTFTSSIGHDACKPPGTAWVNSVIPTSPGFPLHPNQTGEQNMANQVLADY